MFFSPRVCPRIDCAGILKLRNSDIELRKGETDIGRKNTRVRLVFRVHIAQPNGRTVSLQTASNPIECCEYESPHRKSGIFSWLSIWAKGCIHCYNPINWATILLPTGANSVLLHPISFIRSKELAKVIDALYMMPNTHVIYFKFTFYDWMHKLLWWEYPISAGSTKKAFAIHWKKPLFLCHWFVCIGVMLFALWETNYS